MYIREWKVVIIMQISPAVYLKGPTDNSPLIKVISSYTNKRVLVVSLRLYFIKTNLALGTVNCGFSFIEPLSLTYQQCLATMIIVILS